MATRKKSTSPTKAPAPKTTSASVEEASDGPDDHKAEDLLSLKQDVDIATTRGAENAKDLASLSEKVDGIHGMVDKLVQMLQANGAPGQSLTTPTKSQDVRTQDSKKDPETEVPSSEFDGDGQYYEDYSDPDRRASTRQETKTPFKAASQQTRRKSSLEESWVQSQIAKPAQTAMLKMDFPTMSGLPSGEDVEDLFYEDIPRWEHEELLDDGDGPGNSGSNSKKGTTVKVPEMLKYFEGDLLRSLDPHVVFCWLRKAATFQSLSAPARKEFQANWWQTVSSSIMPALQRANYVNVRHSKFTSGLSIENGLVFARVHGARATTRFGPPPGWTLDTTTRFEQLSYRPFVALLKLISVPRDKTRFHQLFVHMVTKRFAKGTGLRKFALTDITTMHQQYAAYWTFMEELLIIYREIWTWCRWAHKGYGYKQPVLPYFGTCGLRSTLLHILGELGNDYLVNMARSFPYQATAEVPMPAPAADPDEVDFDIVTTVQATVTVLSVYQCIKAMNVRMHKLYILSTDRETAAAEDLQPTKEVLLRTPAFDRPELAVMVCNGEGQLPVQERPATLEALDEAALGVEALAEYEEQCSASDHAPDELPFLYALAEQPPPAGKALYDHRASRRDPAQDWTRGICFHSLLGIECNPERCRVQHPEHPDDRFKACRYLLRQTEDRVKHEGIKCTHLRTMLLKLEAEWKRLGLVIPPQPPRSTPADRGQPTPPQRAAPRAPQQGPLKKHQYSPQLAARAVAELSALEYRRQAAACIQDPRFQQLAMLTPDSEEDSGTDLTEEEEAEYPRVAPFTGVVHRFNPSV